MKWTGIYLVSFLVPLCGVLAILAAFLKMGILTSMGAVWAVAAVVILIGVGILIAASQTGIEGYADINQL